MNLVSLSVLKKYAMSFLLAFLTTTVLLALIGVIFSFTSPPMWLLNGCYKYSFLFSAFLAAFFCGYKKAGRGFLTGIIAADIYVIALVILGGLIFRNSIPAASLFKIFLPASLTGAFGGILGINCK